jgi:HEAT repeat protein
VIAAKALGDIRNSVSVSALLDHLSDDDPEVAESCAQSLMRIGGRSVAARLVTLLGVEQVVVRNRAKELLWAMSSEAEDLILRLIKDADAALRLHAAELLRTIPSSHTSRALIKALKDTDPNVRAAAAHSLGQLKEPQAVPILLTMLDDQEWVRFSVIEALASIGDSSAVEPLIKAMEDSSAILKAQITEALGRFGDPRAVHPLLKALPHTDGPLFSQIVITLLKTADTEYLLSELDQRQQDKILPALTDALNDASDSVKEGALKCLSLLGDHSVIYSILDMARHPVSPDIRKQIIQSLVELNDLPPLVVRGQRAGGITCPGGGGGFGGNAGRPCH